VFFVIISGGCPTLEIAVSLGLRVSPDLKHTVCGAFAHKAELIRDVFKELIHRGITDGMNSSLVLKEDLKMVAGVESLEQPGRPCLSVLNDGTQESRALRHFLAKTHDRHRSSADPWDPSHVRSDH
jgi:hypothetical protein